MSAWGAPDPGPTSLNTEAAVRKVGVLRLISTSVVGRTEEGKFRIAHVRMRGDAIVN
jgi:hypothetical protein